MVAIVREADREPVSTVAKQHGISEQTIYAGANALAALSQTMCGGCGILRQRMRG